MTNREIADVLARCESMLALMRYSDSVQQLAREEDPMALEIHVPMGADAEHLRHLCDRASQELRESGAQALGALERAVNVPL